MAILDGLSPTGAWSFHRPLLTSWSSPLYNLTSGAVDTLNDQSGNSRDFTQATAGQRPTITVGGATSVDCGLFDGSNDFLTNAAASNFITSSSGYLIISFEATSVTGSSGTIYNNTGVLADSAGYMGVYLSGTSSPSTATAFNYDGTADYASSAGIAHSSPRVVEWKHESGQVSIRVNGGSWIDTASGSTASLAGALRLGAGYSSPRFHGKLFEAATFSSIPTSGEQDQLVEDFLAPIGSLTSEARVSQAPALVLASEDSEARVTQSALLVLWGIGSEAQVSQSAMLILGRAPVRRIIGITD